MAELGWDESRWQQELTDYQALWARGYTLPSSEKIPDWKVLVAEARRRRKARLPERRRKTIYGTTLAAVILLSAGLALYFLKRRKHI